MHVCFRNHIIYISAFCDCKTDCNRSKILLKSIEKLTSNAAFLKTTKQTGCTHSKFYDYRKNIIN